MCIKWKCARNFILITLLFLVIVALLNSIGCATGYEDEIHAADQQSDYPHKLSGGPGNQGVEPTGIFIEDSGPFDRSLTNQLIDAVIDNDLNRVQSLLDQRANPDFIPNGYDFPAISEAVSHGYDEIALVLLTAGADPDTEGINSVTPVQIASETGDLHMLDNLLEFGADPSGFNDYYLSAMMIAALNGHSDVVDRLMSAIDDPEHRDFKGRQSLYYLCTGAGRLDMPESRPFFYSNREDVDSMAILLGNAYEGDSDFEAQLDAIKILLEAGSEIDFLYDGESSLLYWAVYNQRVDIVELLLERGANPNNGNSVFRRCIEYDNRICEAIRYGNSPQEDLRISDSHTGRHYHEILELLLEAGGEIDFEFHEGGDLYHPVVSTVYSGNIVMMELLIEYGINTDDPWLEQCLMVSINTRQPVMMDRLLELGADPGSESEIWPYTPLLAAIIHGFLPSPSQSDDLSPEEEIVRVLLDAEVDPNVRGASTDTPLMLASRIGTAKLVTDLLNAGADPDFQDPNGLTALMMAAGLGKVDTARVLINGGADISFQGETGYTALILTAVRFHEFRDIFTHGNYGQMAQMIECSDKGFGQQNEVAELLQEAGCETDTKATMYDEASMLEGPTALWYAIENTNVELVRSLLEHGADPNVGGSTYMIAAGRGNSEIIELLQSHDMLIDDEMAYILLNSAIHRGDSGKVTDLLENGADPNMIISQYGDTPVLRAANGGYVEIVNILLEAGADPSFERETGYSLPDKPGYRNRGYWSALMFAVRGNNLNLVRTLVIAGANLETYYINSHTPLMFASGIGNPEIVKLLIESGADVSKTSDYGDTALMCAVMRYEDFLAEFYYPREYSGDMEEVDNRNPVRVVELLLDAGCDPESANDDGETAYTIAVESGYDEIVLMLEEYQHPVP